MSGKRKDYRTLTRIFIENFSEEFDLNIYHSSILKVIAEYCDMPLGYCCLSFTNIEKYSCMSDRQRRRSLSYLIEKSIVEQSFVKKKPIHRIGETIVKKTTEFHVTNDSLTCHMTVQ